jgi:alpha-D-xyloside xylohydrolase
VKDHSVLPIIKVAQSTAEMDWNNVELRVFSSDSAPVSGLFTTPGSDVVSLQLNNTQQGYKLKTDPLGGKVRWQVIRSAGK